MIKLFWTSGICFYLRRFHLQKSQLFSCFLRRSGSSLPLCLTILLHRVKFRIFQPPFLDLQSVLQDFMIIIPPPFCWQSQALTAGHLCWIFGIFQRLSFAILQVNSSSLISSSSRTLLATKYSVNSPLPFSLQSSVSSFTNTPLVLRMLLGALYPSSSDAWSTV